MEKLIIERKRRILEITTIDDEGEIEISIAGIDRRGRLNLEQFIQDINKKEAEQIIKHLKDQFEL